MGTSEFNGGVTLRAMDWHPIRQGEIEILRVALYYRNRDKLRPEEPLDSCVD